MIISGSVVKVVRTFGSTWGKIQPDGESRAIFFNLESLMDAAEYDDLEVGQVVEFEEERDRANGTHAFNIRLVRTAAEA